MLLPPYILVQNSENNRLDFPVKFFSYRITDVNAFDFIVYKIIYIHSKNHLLDDIKKEKF